MHKYIISILSLICLSVANLGAVVVNRAGELANSIPDPASTTTLTVSGHINAADLLFIAEQMPRLQSLDLSKATIDPCDNVLIGTVSRHAANTIPSNVFAGSKATLVLLPTTPGLDIKAGAFASSALERINIPSTVAAVGEGAFAGSKIQKAVIGCSKLDKSAFAGCTALTIVDFSSDIDIPDNAFYGCTALTSIIGIGKITSIGDRAFANCSAMGAFPFSSALTKIGREAFMQNGIKTVDLSGCKSLVSIGEWAFAMMPNLQSLDLGSASQIGQAVAFACPKLSNFKAAAAADVPDFALSKSAKIAGDDIIPANATAIGRYALSGLSGVKTITLPASVETIDDRAMENMTGLETIFADRASVPDLGDDVWYGVEQANVTLIAPDPASADDYRDAAQWREFNITDKETLSADDILDDSTTLAELRARFDGDDLIVRADGVEIERLALYNPAGQLLLAVEPMDDTIAVNTAGFATRVFILHASLADGRFAALKIAR